jgi:hypothetical protein
MSVEQIVFNPNFLNDIKTYFDLKLSDDKIKDIIRETKQSFQLSTEQINAGELEIDEKLETFIDRVEFIGHLNVLSKHAERYNFIIDGQEVQGVHWDINALRLYLALTCIDIFCDRQNHKQYFLDVFNNLPSRLVTELTNYLKIIDDNNETYDIEQFAEFFYNIRNRYTHSGLRFITEGNSIFTLSQTFVVGTKKNKKKKMLQVQKGFDLIDFVLKISIDNANRIFRFY